MKSGILSLLFILSAIAMQAQESARRFAGLMYGMDKKAVKTNFENTRNLTPILEQETDLAYSLDEFEGYPAKSIILRFEEGLLAGGFISMTTTPANLYATYYDLIDKFTAKYGEPAKAVNDGKEVYTAWFTDDGEYAAAININDNKGLYIAFLNGDYLRKIGQENLRKR